jgi:flavodoxin
MKTAIVYYSQHHGNTKKLLDAIKITTSGANPSDGFYKAVTDAVEKKGCKVIGRYGCFGYDTFGPFKLVGGLKKGHPTEEEIEGAVAFFEETIKNNGAE